MGCHFLLQGIFPNQGSKPGLSHYRQTLYHLSHQKPPDQGSLICKGYICKPRTVLFFPPFPKELVTSPTRIDTSIHPCWKSHPSSCSLKEKASQECPEAIPRLPQIHLDQGEGGKGNRKSREDGLRNPPCNPSGLVLSLREGEEWRALTCWVAATGAHWTEGL